MTEKLMGRLLRCLTDWLNKVLDGLPRRTIPVALGDLNTQFGLKKEAGGVTLSTADDEHVGTKGRGSETPRSEFFGFGLNEIILPL